MTRSPFVSAAIPAALVTAAAGCAAHPARPSSPVADDLPPVLLQAAGRLGYRPERYDAQTIFCQREASTGTMIPREHCIGSGALISDVSGQRRLLRQIERVRGRTIPNVSAPPTH